MRDRYTTRSSKSWSDGSILVRFAVTALIVFVAVGILLYFLLDAQSMRERKRQSVFFAEVLSKAIEGSKVITSMQMQGPVPPIDQIPPELRDALERVARAFDVDAWKSVRVTNSAGVVVLSSDLRILGRSLPSEVALHATARGRAYQEMVPAGEARERLYGDEAVLVTWAPFRLEPGGPIVGAVELVQSYAEQRQEVQAQVAANLFTVGACLVLLYLLLLPIVARVSHIQREQARRDAELLSLERETVGRLRELDAAKDELLAFSAHEFRTPLTSLLGFAQLLRDRRHVLSDALVDEHLDTIVRQARRLDRVARDFLDAAAIEAGRLDVAIEPLDPRAIAERVAAEFPSVHITIDADGAPHVLADRDRLEQVLTNLIRNAVVHGPPDGRVRISSRREGDRCLIDVADSGTGLTAADFERVRHKFERGDRAAEGAGLGLYISTKLMEAQGGSLDFVPDAATTTFRLSLPVATDTTGVPGRPAPEEVPVSG
jgi:signal transduction histidine kinase